MDMALPTAIVTGYEDLTDTVSLPDPDDRHVLAAAIRCEASTIVTLNLVHFPTSALAPFNIEAQHPDDFVLALLEMSSDLVLEAAENHRTSLTNPPRTVEEYVTDLQAQGLRKSVSELRILFAASGAAPQKAASK